MENFHQEFQAGIIDQEIHAHHNHVSAQLLASAEVGRCEGYIFLQQESGEERDRKCDQQSRNVRTDGDELQIHDLLSENKVVEDEIEDPVENDICATADGIPEKLPADVAFKRRIEKVDARPDGFADGIKQFAYCSRKSHSCLCFWFETVTG